MFMVNVSVPYESGPNIVAKNSDRVAAAIAALRDMGGRVQPGTVEREQGLLLSVEVPRGVNLAEVRSDLFTVLRD
jgi:hypothetical protein